MLRGGGGTTSYDVVLTQELEVLAIVVGGGSAKGFHPLIGGSKRFIPVLRGGVQKVSDQRSSHVVAPPPPSL